MLPPSSTVCERGFDAFAFGKPRNDAAKLKAGTRANRGASDSDFGATVGNPTVGGSGGNCKELAELRFGDESLVAEAGILIFRHDFIFSCLLRGGDCLRLSRVRSPCRVRTGAFKHFFDAPFSGSPPPKREFAGKSPAIPHE